MNWQDLFYFSKGERRALTVLLILIVLSWLTLQLKENQEETETGQVATVVPPTVVPAPSPAVVHTAESTKSRPPATATGNKKSFFRKDARFLPKENKISSERKYTRADKFPVGTIVELNTADTTTLKKVPGIGSAFAGRIVRFRNLLGGFCSVTQLSEVYGIDEERYESLKTWFTADPAAIDRLQVNRLSAKELDKHPYLNYRQARSIEHLVKQKGRLTGWENLRLLEEFTEADRERLAPYLSYE